MEIFHLKKIFGIFTICPIYKIDITNDYKIIDNETTILKNKSKKKQLEKI